MDGEGGGLLPCHRQAGDGALLVFGHQFLDDDHHPILVLVVGDTDGADGPRRFGRFLQGLRIG